MGELGLRGYGLGELEGFGGMVWWIGVGGWDG